MKTITDAAQGVQQKAQETEKKIISAEKTLAATDEKVRVLAESSQGLSDALVKNAVAEPKDTERLRSDLSQFKKNMDLSKSTPRIFVNVLMPLAIILTVLSLSLSLRNKGSEGAVVGIVVAGIVAANAYWKFDAQVQLYELLRGQAAGKLSLLNDSKLTYGQWREINETLEKLQDAAGTVPKGDFAATIEALSSTGKQSGQMKK